ncbi:hypothetical protein HDE_01643 [Halotydeus destructor]|nr:hypothetical protein HDE_01643 [Halotydeus destructor]
MDPTLRLSYYRFTGLIQQHFQDDAEELGFNETGTSQELEGTFSAYPNYIVKYFRQRGINTTLVRPIIKDDMLAAMGKLVSDNEADVSAYPLMTHQLDVEYGANLIEGSGRLLQIVYNDSKVPVDFLQQYLQVYEWYYVIIFLAFITLISFALTDRTEAKCHNRPCFENFLACLRMFVDQYDFKLTFRIAQRCLLVIVIVSTMFLAYFAENCIGATYVYKDKNLVKSLKDLIHRDPNSIYVASFAIEMDLLSASHDINKRTVYDKFFQRKESKLVFNEGMSVFDEFVKSTSDRKEWLLIAVDFFLDWESAILCNLCEPDSKFKITNLDGMVMPMAYAHGKNMTWEWKKWVNIVYV